MNLVYNTDVVISAVESYLEANHVAKDAPFGREVIIYDQLVGWLETMLRAPVAPAYVVLDEDDFEILSSYLKEV
jgi:hypothetical protein